MERSCVTNPLTGRMKCYFCQSSGLYSSDKWKHHDIKMVIASNETQEYWWQSQPGVENVTVQFHLEDIFEVRSIFFQFPHSVPGELILEASSDKGKNWKTRFEFVSEDDEVDNVTNIHKTSPFFYEFNEINDRIITNIRLNFTKFRVENSSRSPFYSMSNMVVNGTCFCHGHGLACSPKRGHQFPHDSNIVHSKCVCGHNTQGDYCDSCLPLYNDHPWAPVAQCVKCNCNQRASECLFDQVSYDYSGSTSGGICQDCSEHRAGKHCEKCQASFFLDRKTDFCEPCDCFMKGSLGNMCDQTTGQCLCKPGFIGRSCHDKNETFHASLPERTWTAKGVIEAGPETSIPFEFKVKDLRSLIRYLTRL